MVESQKGILTEDCWRTNLINPLRKNSSRISNRQRLNTSQIGDKYIEYRSITIYVK